MKTILAAAAIILLLTTCTDTQNQWRGDEINPVIGNLSYTSAHGTSPSIETDEQLRIICHLSYVHARLSKASTAHLTAEKQRKRADLLALLEQYIKTEEFPINTAYKDERKPCFIDENGTLCAVGYLVANTAGLHTAQNINSRFQYDLIHEMDTALIGNWARSNGLTVEECAMIQPTYPGTTNTGSISYSAGITTAAWSGVNGALTLMNTQSMHSQEDSYRNALIGLISGGGQCVFGSLALYESTASNTIFPNRIPFGGVNGRLQTAGFVNIAFGASTMFTSLLRANRVWSYRKMNQTDVSLFSTNTTLGQGAYGLSFRYTF